MSDNEARQEGNTVHGDMAARDINKTHNYYRTQPDISPISKLIEKYEKEKSDNIEFKEIVAKLQHYMRQVPEGDVIGLEAKLAAGGYVGIIEFASYTKELFAKKLADYQFSESAQKLHVHFLAEIYSRFHQHVYPAIQSSRPQIEINALVQTTVIDPVRNMLEDNVTEIYAEEINGMLYFLTGNCHIKWV